MSFVVSRGQTWEKRNSWDDYNWIDSVEMAIMVQDTFVFNGFRVVDRRPVDQRIRPMDTLYEENYTRIRIQSIRNDSDSNIILRSRNTDLEIHHRYYGHEIKARLGLDTAVLYVGETLHTDTIWLDTLVFQVKPLERLTRYSYYDSVCIGMLPINTELFGGLGSGMCAYIVPCKITEFKVRVSGSINEQFEMKSSYYSHELISCFYRMKPGDEIFFFDIRGKSSKTKNPISFKNKKMVAKDCSW